ncbi:MAG TPA: LytR C-terminal domain-containing protein, partial [Candidatus Gracilibacteria bacterium]|nr:LytR C-terminal domain-containing protein [Candidatus Gracilibacteria bacterium]
LFKYRDLQFAKFEVLNGTPYRGLASNAENILKRYGIPVVSTGNAPSEQEWEKSEIWIYKKNPGLEAALPLLQEIIPLEIVDKVGYYQETDVDASFILGKDFYKYAL